MTHNGKSDLPIREEQHRRFDDEDNEEANAEKKRMLPFAAVNSKIADLTDRVGGLEETSKLILNALNGFVNVRGGLSRIDMVEKEQEILAAEMRMLNKEIEGLKSADHSALLLRVADCMDMVNSKLKLYP
jgi:hypothetical protein